jgi:hypothetical protein
MFDKFNDEGRAQRQAKKDADKLKGLLSTRKAAMVVATGETRDRLAKEIAKLEADIADLSNRSRP